MKIINAPSLANCSFLEMGSQVEQLAKGKADWFHIDLCDGHYVPNILFSPAIVWELKAAYPEIPVDVHLMTIDPASYISRLAYLGADYISFHLDAERFARRLITNIHGHGIKAGVIINPSQRIDLLQPVIDMVDYVVLMTVEPGFAGQKFMPQAIPRLAELVDLRKQSGRDFLISIDGGVDMENAVKCAKLGAEIYITGIFTVFKQPEGLEQACLNFKEKVINGCKS
ncbi:MAG: ribulose-phosphate 3-epimerase [Oscillospiraceae bacterium]|nr:ribulose-phosphate 3-epimerase [Oscillospiraceae bacterium]